jgi:hypothetical protein
MERAELMAAYLVGRPRRSDQVREASCHRPAFSSRASSGRMSLYKKGYEIDWEKDKGVCDVDAHALRSFSGLRPAC